MTVSFRDPPPASERKKALEQQLAALLARAPTLPVKLPVDDLWLKGVDADRSGIDLMLSRRTDSARLRLVEKQGAVAGDVVGASAGLPAPTLQLLATRLAAATTPERWKQARALADELRALPVGVELDFLRQIVSGVRPLQGLVRTGFRCNQDCGLCWQSREWNDFGEAQVRTWIEDLAAAGVRRLIISGGEPTIDPALFRHLETAKGLGFTHLTLETNAVRMAKPPMAQRLAEAGVTSAFVSLHAADAKLSDEITRAPGTHQATIAGVSALLEAGIEVTLNAVMTVQSVDALPALPGFVRERFGAHPKLDGLMVSYPAPPFERDLQSAAAPPPASLRTALRATLEAAWQAKLPIRGLTGPCGPPLCAYGADPRFADEAPVPEKVEFRMYLPACERCSVKSRCFGVREADFQKYGDACALPIP